MKHSIYILASALAIFIATLFVTNNYLVDETVDEADSINDMHVRRVRRHMDNSLMMREQAVHSFLSGMLYYDIDTMGGKLDTVVYIREKEIPRFRKYVYDSLHDFMKLNPNILSASFLIDPSVYPNMGSKGFAPTMNHGDTTGYDLADNYDFLDAKSYQMLKKSMDCIWLLPSKNSRMAGKSIIYYVPIKRQNGKFFGVFAINVSINVLRNGLAESLPYDNGSSFILTTDNNDNIIVSTNDFTNKFKKYSSYKAFLEADDNYLKETSESIHHDVVTWYGKDYFVYHSTLKHAPWQTITVCKKNAIYEDVTETRNMIFMVSAVGMLLMLVCCVVVFRREKTHLEQKAAVEEELKMAAKVQQSLLKPTTFHAGSTRLETFMRPAREAGGDLYDYVEKNGKLLFCIGDVSGKGMPAAMFMTQIVSLFRNAAMFTDKPDQIVDQINNVLAPNNPDMTFCTFFVGVIDNDRRTMTFCNAGHNRPVIIPSAQSGSRPYYITVKPNLALGLMENFPYETDTLTLNEGDTLLLYTDGVTEAKNAAHEFFGEEALLKAATNPSVDNIVSSVDSFVNGYEQSDDITVMTVHSV